jgi:hypothetical protein
VLISYHLPTLFRPGSSPVENAEVLQVLEEALIAIDIIHMRHHPETPELIDPRFGVRYGRTDEWQTIPALFLAGYGDCKSLTAMRVAQHRVKGNKWARPVFRFRRNSSGGTDYHILVQIGVNKFEDPSKECGMTDNEWAHFSRGRYGW